MLFCLAQVDGGRVFLRSAADGAGEECLVHVPVDQHCLGPAGMMRLAALLLAAPPPLLASLDLRCTLRFMCIRGDTCHSLLTVGHVCVCFSVWTCVAVLPVLIQHIPVTSHPISRRGLPVMRLHTSMCCLCARVPCTIVG